MGLQTLRRHERLTHAREFARVYARKCRQQGTWLRIHVCQNELPYSRIGLAVGKTWGPAHVRNRIKRLYREAFRLTKSERPTGMDLVLVPVKTAGLNLECLKRELTDLSQQAWMRLQKQ